MSAIWGVVALDGKEIIPKEVNTIFEKEYREHCKIDRFESRTVGSAYFGCGIQYITREAEAEELPIIDKKRGIIFTADCILDNREEVIELVKGDSIDENFENTVSDATLMYLAYIRFGIDCVRHFRGLFSMAVWEEEEHSLTLVSDQASARCLYYIQKGNLLAFSTLMSPLNNLFPGLEQNMAYYKDFLLADPSLIYVVPGETPYKEIRLMLPATYLTIGAKGEESHTYWSPADSKEAYNCRNAKEYGDCFMRLYRECVKEALRTSGEAGIAMSSGLDSSSIGVLAAEELKKQGKELFSYTFVPYEKPDRSVINNYVYDESSFVNEIANMYPNIKTTFLNNQGRNIFADMEECLTILEMPYKTGTFPNHYEMCQAGAAKGCRIFLNGGFGNTTVSFGYINHILYDLYKSKHFFTMLLYLNHYAKHEKISRKYMVKSLLKNFHRFSKDTKNPLEKFCPRNPFILPAILKDYDLIKRFGTDKRSLASRGYIDKLRYADFLKSTNLLIQLGVFETKFGLNTGMLLRDPTKDIRLMTFCAKLPYHMFAYKGVTRWLIRSNFETLLPQSVISRWQQHGLLNYDWIDRVYWDWDSIKPDILRHLSAGEFDDFLLKEQLIQFIEDFGIDKEKDGVKLPYLCAIDCLFRFMERFS